MLLSVVVVLGVILGLLLGVDLWKKKKMSRGGSIPGPPARPIIGNLLLFSHCRGTPDMIETFARISQEYNNFMRLWMGNVFMVFVSDPEYVEKAMAHVSAMKKPYYISFFKLFTGGVFTEEGPTWHELRRMLTTSLYKKDLEVYMETFKHKSDILVERLNQRKNEFIDPSQDLGNILFDIGMNNFYGVESDRLGKGEPGILHHLETIVSAILVRMYKPWLHFEFLYTMTPTYKKGASLANFLKTAILEAVLRRKELKKAEDMLDENSPNSVYRRNVYLDRISEWNIGKGVNDPAQDMNMTLDIMLAGMETTLTTLSTTFYYLSHHPEWQEKLYEEYCDVLGACRITPETVNKLPLTDMVINEVLRLHSPSVLGRVTTEDIQMGEYTVPEGANLIFFTYGLHRNPAHWEKPNEFYPEHFSPEQVARRPKMSFIPFSVGTRKCPGNVYSNWISKTLLSDIIMNFRIETDMPKDVKIKFLIMSMLDHKYSFKFIPREP